MYINEKIGPKSEIVKNVYLNPMNVILILLITVDVKELIDSVREGMEQDTFIKNNNIHEMVACHPPSVKHAVSKYEVKYFFM